MPKKSKFVRKSVLELKDWLLNDAQKLDELRNSIAIAAQHIDRLLIDKKQGK